MPRIVDLAVRLGGTVPDHVLEFMSSHQAGVLLANAGHASPHWRDGMAIFQSMLQRIAALEYVTAGCPACHSVYQNTTALIHQISVVLHVFGHIHVFKNSNFFKLISPADTTRASLELAEYMAWAKSEYGSNEVDAFYQVLESFADVQDLQVGSYDSVESLKQRIRDKAEGKDEHFRPTASLLQAFVASLPENAPTWKHKLAILYEERHSWITPATQNKIINEGWATFWGQHLLLKHLPELHEFSHLFSFEQLISGLVGTEKNHPLVVQNKSPGALPYYLGMHGWRNIYERFRQRPEIRILTDEFEIDRLFTEYATQEIIAPMSNQDFMMEAFDAKWVNKWNLILARELEPTDPEFEAYKGQNDKGEPYIVLSAANSWKRTLMAYARRVARMGVGRPRIVFEDPMDSSGMVRLRHDLHANEGAPISIENSVLPLHLMAKELGRPVALHFIHDPALLGLNISTPSTDSGEAGSENTALPGGVEKMKIVVEPSGLVSVETVDGQYRFSRDDEEKLEGLLKSYELDMELSYGVSGGSGISTEVAAKLVLADGSTASEGGVSSGPLSSAPTSGAAMLEYIRFMKKRTSKVIDEVLSGKKGAVFGKNGIRIKAVPTIPTFELDFKSAGTMRGHFLNLKTSPVYGRGELESPYDDDSARLLSRKAIAGEVIFIPKPENQQGQGNGESGQGDPSDGGQGQGDQQGSGDSGQGQGQGDQEGSGDGGQGQGQGEPDPKDVLEGENDKGAGQGAGSGGGGEPSQVEVDWSSWIEILEEKMELRNLRRTEGREKMQDEIRGGYVASDNEPYHNDENMEMAYLYGLQYLIFQGKTEEEVLAMDPQELIEIGFPLIPRENLISYGWDQVQVPDFNAVVVLAIDLSGSMKGNPTGRAKKLFTNLFHYVKKHYPHAIVRFVAFDSEAHEYDNEDEFWKAELGASTFYGAGVRKAKEIFESYPAARYNRYFFLAGDSEDQANEVDNTVRELEELILDIDDAAYFHVGNSPVTATSPGTNSASFKFMSRIRSLARRHPDKFAYTEWTENFGSLFKSIKDIFGKREGR